MSVADDTTEDHGHHLPAVEDWPRGFGEASWWPFITAIGGSGLYIGAALFVLGHGGNDIVGSMTGPAVFVASAAVFLTGIYGWLYHAFVKHFWSRETSGGGALRWGMILFLGTEIATFGAGFTYYFFIRAGAWPPAGAELPHLVNSLVLVNTGILVLSSVTLHWAHSQIRKENHSGFLLGLAVTLLLGVVFLGGQLYEYYQFIIHEGFTLTSGIFGSAFFGLTGLHGLHVTLGAILIAFLTVRAAFGQYSADRHTSVSTVSMYWHFVDAIWVFLVVVLYVGATV